jgi:hypothetical protein
MSTYDKAGFGFKLKLKRTAAELSEVVGHEVHASDLIHVHTNAGVCVPPAVRESLLTDPEQYGDCCIGAAVYGIGRCTCWEPVFDLAQQPLLNGGAAPAPEDIAVRAKCCADCAYRNDSAERGDLDGTAELLDVAHSERREFWCHQGVARVVALRHPDGRELPAGEGDYRPPVGPAERPIVWKADGTPGERCAGWAAHRGRG